MLNPSQYTNIVELLFDRAAHHPDQAALTFLGDGDNVTHRFTSASLHQQVSAVAAQLEPAEKQQKE